MMIEACILSQVLTSLLSARDRFDSTRVATLQVSAVRSEDDLRLCTHNIFGAIFLDPKTKDTHTVTHTYTKPDEAAIRKELDETPLICYRRMRASSFGWRCVDCTIQGKLGQ